MDLDLLARSMSPTLIPGGTLPFAVTRCNSSSIAAEASVFRHTKVCNGKSTTDMVYGDLLCPAVNFDVAPSIRIGLIWVCHLDLGSQMKIDAMLM